LNERVVDHDDARRFGRIVGREAAPANERNPERPEVPRRHVSKSGDAPIRGVGGTSLDAEVRFPSGLLKRNELRKSRRGDAGKRGDARFDRVVIALSRLWRDVQGDNVCRHHAGLNFLQPDHFANDHRGAEREHERERDLDRDQGVAEPTERAADRRAAAALSGNLLHADARGGERRREAEEDRVCQAEHEQEHERLPVEDDLMRPRQPRRGDSHEQIRANASDDDAQRSAGERQQQTFDQELPHQTARARAESGARDDLPCSRAHPRQQQVRHVRAGSGEDEPYCGE
jgi:hypothetical protein